MRALAFAFLGLNLLACDRLFHRHTRADPGADASAGVTATELEEEDEATTTDAGACPLPIHPAYCRRNCRSFASRQATKHARRISHSARAGLGTCGEYDVFAEDEELGDAGVGSGVVEYFDKKTGVIVGAVDTRSKPCGRFGTVPTCTPVIAWERPLSIKFGRITATGSRLPFEVIERVVRQSFPRFKLCYAKNDAGDAAPVGQVTVKIKIEADGSVSSAEDAGSDLPSDDVKKCVVHTFSSMSMPEPEGHASMTVTIPIVFTH
jgi:hypothetical protein